MVENSQICWRYTIEIFFTLVVSMVTGVPEVIRGRGGANRAKGASRTRGANHRQRGRVAKTRHFAMFCYHNFFLLLAQSKHKKFDALLPPWAKGGRGGRLL